jgi:hypothetical protein
LKSVGEQTIGKWFFLKEIRYFMIGFQSTSFYFFYNKGFGSLPSKGKSTSLGLLKIM